MIVIRMNIQKLKQNIRLKSFTGVVLAVLVLVSVFTIPRVRANQIDDQIRALQQQNEVNRKNVNQLQDQATSYQDAINKLQAQIVAVQTQIDANTVEQKRLQNEIEKTEEELTKQKRVLGENIKAMYLEGQITTLEMLASSKDLSEFVDKEQYRNSVKDKIKITLESITNLKRELTTKKENIEALLKQQSDQQEQLAQNRLEQANLLSYNQGQQADFNNKTKDNQAKIDSLIAEQRRVNFSPDGGYYFLHFPGSPHDFNPDAYPYKNAGFGMSPGGCVDNDGPDPWGYCTRQCVSFAAWAVLASGRSVPIGYGSARDWVAAAYARGIPVSRSPQPGDVAISTAGYWGHAMYVKSVSGNQFISYEYNSYLDGRFHSFPRTF